MKVCDKCGASLVDEAKFCNKCGAMVSSICPNCERENDASSVYCLYCGARIKKEERPGPEPASSRINLKKEPEEKTSSYTYQAPHFEHQAPRFEQDATVQDTESIRFQNAPQDPNNGCDVAPVVEKVTMFTAYQKFAVFSGRATRKEFWLFVLFTFIVGFAVGYFVGGETADAIISLFSLVNFIPGVALSVRRLHDIGKSGWWMLIGLVPILGDIILILFFLRASEARSNEYGPYTIAQ